MNTLLDPFCPSRNWQPLQTVSGIHQFCINPNLPFLETKQCDGSGFFDK
jgi:hypothetical protein